jgi:hypothetical protein
VDLNSSLFFYSFEYNQQDATLYNILYFGQCSTSFRRFLRPSPTSMGEFQLTHASGSSKQAWHIPDAVCTVFELLMMGGETA